MQWVGEEKIVNKVQNSCGRYKEEIFVKYLVNKIQNQFSDVVFQIKMINVCSIVSNTKCPNRGLR